jgi:hypothetical protein
MRAARIRIGIHRDSGNAHFLGSTNNAASNFTAIGYENFFEHGGSYYIRHPEFISGYMGKYQN